MHRDDESYIDEKGRTRWKGNDALAVLLGDLHDMLVVGGYDADHAARYPRLAHLISRFPESVRALHKAGRLGELPGVGPIVQTILAELITTGTCAKMTEPSAESNYNPPPLSVLELTAIPGLGAKTVRRLYSEYGIASLTALQAALNDETLAGFKGIGPKTRAAILAA